MHPHALLLSSDSAPEHDATIHDLVVKNTLLHDHWKLGTDTGSLPGWDASILRQKLEPFHSKWLLHELAIFSSPHDRRKLSTDMGSIPGWDVSILRPEDGAFLHQGAHPTY